ncbi:MAG: helicase-related protein [Streptococcus sp.]
MIATDAISEGQNLQDADMMVNYDIHWNPVPDHSTLWTCGSDWK